MKSKPDLLKYRYIIPAVIESLKYIIGDRNRKDPDGKGFFFIIGSGRNGSTLLSAILNKHPNVFVPPEQYVLPFGAMKWQLLRWKSLNNQIEELLKSYASKIKTINWELKIESIEQMISALPLESINYETVNYTIYQKYAETVYKKTPEIVGDKTPLLTHYIPIVNKEFPKSKYIFLLRDPRAVVYSYSTMKDHPASDLEYAIWKWKDSLKMYEYLKEVGADTLLIRYESLVSNPDETINKILKHLQLETIEGLLDFDGEVRKLGVSNLSYHQNLKNPVNTNSIDKWRTKLEDEKKARIKQELAEIASKYNIIL